MGVVIVGLSIAWLMGGLRFSFLWVILLGYAVYKFQSSHLKKDWQLCAF
jgi:TRAP-type C4-dicarboxylate transport system permease small subunit